MARPKLNIDPEHVEKLAALDCTHAEIAAFFGCSRDTIGGRFSAEIKKGKEEGKTRLRRMMWKSALGGSVVMQIFLSKNILGYSDKAEVNQNIKAGLTTTSSGRRSTAEVDAWLARKEARQAAREAKERGSSREADDDGSGPPNRLTRG